MLVRPFLSLINVRVRRYVCELDVFRESGEKAELSDRVTA
jgi:hypothetical protein